jgi:hypothetical protein
MVRRALLPEQAAEPLRRDRKLLHRTSNAYGVVDR